MTAGLGDRLLAFGEIMLRLSPPARELLLLTPVLRVWLAGAEANVVIQLARLGHDVALASRVPDNALGHAEARADIASTSLAIQRCDRLHMMSQDRVRRSPTSGLEFSHQFTCRDVHIHLRRVSGFRIPFAS